MGALRTKEAEIAKTKTKEAALAATAALESAREDKHEAATLRAKADEEDRLLRLGFAAFLVQQESAYLQDNDIGTSWTCHGFEPRPSKR